MKRFLLLSIFLLISFFIISRSSIVKTLSPVPDYTNISDRLISSSSKVIGYQITKDGTGVLYLVFNGTTQDVYLWSENGNSTTKLNSADIPWEIHPEGVAFAKSYLDTDGNAYFSSGVYLIRVSNDLKVTYYRNLPAYLLYTDEEFKTASKLFKRLIDKYSTEQINAFKTSDSAELTTYLIDIDNGYYIESESTTLSLERFPLDGENVNTVIPNDYLKVKYKAKWDAAIGKLNDKAAIDTVTETVKVAPKILTQSKSYDFAFPDVMEVDKTYSVINEAYIGKLQLFCYVDLSSYVSDSPTCRSRKLFLKLNGHEYVLPSTQPETYSGFFIYFPSDKRFFTSSGSFMFLSPQYSLYKLK